MKRLHPLLTDIFLRKMGSWAFVMLGVGHLVTQLTIPHSPERDAVTDAMALFIIEMPGRVGTMLDYHQGFSLMMGFLLIGYGVRTLLQLRCKSHIANDEVSLLMCDVAVSVVAFAVSANHFFAVPVALTGLALLAFSAALVMTWSKAFSKPV